MDIKKAQELYQKSESDKGSKDSLNGFDYILYYYYKAKIKFHVERSIKSLGNSYSFYIYNASNSSVRALQVISKEYRDLGFRSSVTINKFAYENKLIFDVWGWAK